MFAEYKSGKPKVLEPHKCECWDWFEWSNLPHPLFIPITNLINLKDTAKLTLPVE